MRRGRVATCSIGEPVVVSTRADQGQHRGQDSMLPSAGVMSKLGEQALRRTTTAASHPSVSDVDAVADNAAPGFANWHYFCHCSSS
jgi:hypothetical protein